jgi:hypothetical protein
MASRQSDKRRRLFRAVVGRSPKYAYNVTAGCAGVPEEVSVVQNTKPQFCSDHSNSRNSTRFKVPVRDTSALPYNGHEMSRTARLTLERV